MKPEKQTFLKPCLTVLLLLWALLGVWSIRGLSPNVDWPLSDYSGYLCKIFIRPQENREWMRYNVSVDYTQQKFYIYDGQKGEWKPHDLLNEHPQYQIFIRDRENTLHIKNGEKPTLSFILTSDPNFPSPIGYPEISYIDEGYFLDKPVIYLYPEAETEKLRHVLDEHGAAHPDILRARARLIKLSPSG